jgi:hypothetical protein
MPSQGYDRLLQLPKLNLVEVIGQTIECSVGPLQRDAHQQVSSVFHGIGQLDREGAASGDEPGDFLTAGGSVTQHRARAPTV